ncbi:hypothetical protein RF11_03660 [Thelohanellus kitauei]|uniref:Uncharacterized protein n=1 Tax=Thelohanellus kitauei TaxID=669202 RepID=A0A0C2J3I4_THEKT|nr:hypothetical protein RF11_03660 [Thelohanellus kitauei]
MKLLRKFCWSNGRMLCRTYDDVLEAIDMGRLIVLASHGLLSHDEPTFNECLNVFVELFKGPYNTICEERPETNSIVVHLYNSHAHRIVRDCIEAILTRRKISYVRGCGKVLYIMKHVEFDGIRPLFKIDKWLVNDILETYSDEIRANENISSTIIKILNSSTEEKAVDLAVTLNSTLFAA